MLPHYSFLAYIGPETLMPLATFLSAVLGILLIFWRFLSRKIKTAFTKAIRIFTRNHEG